jgi:GNAT superfamily N-acetyltransferase
MGDSMVIKKLDTSDAKSIAEVHYESFKNFFLTSLGKPFLVQFYKSVLSHPNGFGFGVLFEGELVGFAIGTKNSSKFYKSILKSNGIKMGIAAFVRLLINPSKIKRLINAFLSSNVSLYKEIPVLLSICVSIRVESKGVGKQLLNAFENELKIKGFNSVALTTDTYDNDYVNQFYTRNNYLKVKSFFQGKREMNLYHKTL